jgi:ubiquinone/menaquinone biosynthesis C-methylase UbiE
MMGIREGNTGTSMHPGATAIGSAMWATVDQNQDAAVRYLNLLTGLLEAMKLRATDALRLKPGDRVLELACGLGKDAEQLAARVVPGGHVIATDLSAELIAQAAARVAPLGLPLAFQVADALDLPFAAASFDAARVERMLQHVANPLQVVREMVRVVRPGGRVVTLEPDWDSVSASGGDIVVLRAIRRYLTDVQHATGRAGSLTPQLLHQAGCRDIAIEVAVLPLLQLALADSVVFLAKALEGAVQQGWISEPAARAWWEEAAARDRAGCFCGWINGVIVSATVA